eukprot:COSAG06_NODE_53931_length_297_cov_0.808081_1_plen_61_part_10
MTGRCIIISHLSLAAAPAGGAARQAGRQWHSDQTRQTVAASAMLLPLTNTDPGSPGSDGRP